MNSIRRGWWWAALLVTLAGLGVSIYLTQEHYKVLQSGIDGRSFCDVSSYFTCSIVLNSRYSVLGTLPLAGLGLLFYLYMLGALLYARLEEESSIKILALPWLLSFLSLLLSTALGYLSLYKLKSFCIFCTSLYVVSILLFVFLTAALGVKRKTWTRSLKIIPWGKSIAYLAVLFSIGSILLHSAHRKYAKEELSPAQSEQYLRAFFAAPKIEFQTEGRPFWGNPNAEIVIVEFSDFECPVCRKAAFELKPMLIGYRDKIKLVFLNYPLGISCNPLVPKNFHPQACQAAYAAHCAHQQGKFWEYHDEAFDQQPKFSAADLEEIAKKIQLDLPAFRACLSAESTQHFIRQDIEQAHRASVHGTPSVYINGRFFPAWTSKQLLHRAIDGLLEGRK